MSIWASFEDANLPVILVQVKPKYNIIMYSELNSDTFFKIFF